MKKTTAILLTVFCAACLLVSAILGIVGGVSYSRYAALEEGENIMFIEVEGYGVMTAELYPEEAPITVANFKKLAGEKFYDGLIFHRVISGFMIQGGDPNGDGSGGSPNKITGEFAINGVQNDIKHERGVLSMARRSYPYDSASSQFFIVHETSEHLDGKYAAFGRLTDGIEIVDKIASVGTDSNDKPYKDVVIKTVTAEKENLSLNPSGAFITAICFGAATLLGALAATLLFLSAKKEAKAKAEALALQRRSQRKK